MYSDIIPPKKNSFINNKKGYDHEVRILKKTDIYHTVDGKDKTSKTPLILFFITIVILSAVYYSIFNNNTYISFESKTVILEVKDNISMSLSEKNQNSSTTLSYNLIYVNSDDSRNIFAPISTSTDAIDENKNFHIIKATSTSNLPSKKIIFINETNTPIEVIENTRLDVDGDVYFLSSKVNIPPTNKESISSTTSKYKVIGFKNTNIYDRFYAIDYIDEDVMISTSSASVDNSDVPNNDILSLIPENFIPLKKSYIYDNALNQSALVVIDKKDFEKSLYANSRLIQDYIKVFEPIFDLIEYEININDYTLDISNDTGHPVSFKDLNLEITPRVKKDKVAEIFTGFSKETMKKIKGEISKNMTMTVKYSPFWMSKVSDVNHINVEVK